MLIHTGRFSALRRRKERSMKRLSGILLMILLAALLGMGVMAFTTAAVPTGM